MCMDNVFWLPRRVITECPFGLSNNSKSLKLYLAARSEKLLFEWPHFKLYRTPLKTAPGRRGARVGFSRRGWSAQRCSLVDNRLLSQETPLVSEYVSV